MRAITTGILLLLGIHLHSQIVVSPGAIHFGTFTRDSEAVVDILVENKSDKNDFLLRHTFSPEYDVRISSKSIPGRGQSVIRIRFNPRITGDFSEEIQLYFASSNTPIVFPVTADVMYINPNGNIPCPDFSEREAECCASNMFLVKVVDDETGLPIPKATVKVEEDGYIHLHLNTNVDGVVTQEARIGYFLIRAEKTGYFPSSITSYINKRNNRFELRLKRDPEFNPKTDALYIPPDTVLFKEEELLPVSLYSPNNVVFLLDISGSMGVGDKMDLMRLALDKMALVVRDIDKITIVSYANEAQVILPTSTGADKALITQVISELKAGGKTSGTKGFKRSYGILRKERIQEGNNQLIVITDGAFRPEDQTGIDKLVSRANASGFQTSLVAIRSSEFAAEKLSSLAGKGNGSFLRIDSTSDAESALIEELRKQSRK